MSVLVVANNYGGSVHKNTNEAVVYGKKVAEDLGTDLLVAVYGPSDNIDSLGEYGAGKVLHYGSDSLSNFDPSVLTNAIASTVEAQGISVVIFSHDYSGKSVAPRLSARLKAGLVSGAVDFPNTSGGFSVKKAVFSGKAFAEMQIHSDKKIVSLLPNSIEVVKSGGSVSIENAEVETSPSTVTVKEVKKESNKLSLTEAEVVVSAGRGLKGPENWGMIENFAENIGAATACSRPVADIGWRPHHEHVGQTGVAVRPNLYFAIGISGAIQHLAGVNGSKVIVVINTDPEAPFFKAADYGIVGDAFEVVPKLVEASKNL